MIIDELIDAIAAKGGNPSVIGLDPAWTICPTICAQSAIR